MLECSVAIGAPAGAVWAALVDVARWPEWTASVTHVERLDGGAFGLGSRVRVKQPRMPAMVWEVVEFAAGRSFGWRATSGGVTTVAGHEIHDEVDGVRVELTIRQTGLLVPVVRLLVGARTRRYMRREADGLKRRVEAPYS